jgi:hypothetical protein
MLTNVEHLPRNAKKKLLHEGGQYPQGWEPATLLGFTPSVRSLYSVHFYPVCSSTVKLQSSWAPEAPSSSLVSQRLPTPTGQVTPTLTL